MAKKDENILFKKTNTLPIKIWNVFKKIIRGICKIIVALFSIIFEFFWEIVIFAFMIIVPWKVISCCSQEDAASTAFIERVNSKEIFVADKYKKSKTFKYNVKFYKEDDDWFRITTINDSIIDSFKIDRKDITIYEHRGIDTPYVEIIAERRPGKICSFFCSIDRINEVDYIDGYSYPSISWGLRDKNQFNAKCETWFDNKILYDVTDLVKTKDLRLDQDTDESFKNRRYYILYKVTEMKLHVPSYEPLQKEPEEIKEEKKEDPIEFTKAKKQTYSSVDSAAMKRVQEKIQAALADSIPSKPLDKHSSVQRYMLCYY